MEPATAADYIQIHIVRDSRNLTNKGLAFIQYSEPEHASLALQNLDGQSFQGRLMHILPASDKKETKQLNDFEISKLPLKQQKAIKRKTDAASATFSWNSLYMNPDAVLASVAQRLGVSKAEVLDPASSDAAVKQAHAETNVIAETKEYLRSHGVDVDAFKNSQRDDTTLLLKNFPFGTTTEELTALLAPFGEVARFIFPPSGTMAIAKFAELDAAKQAIKELAYRNIKGVPLYLEKAPYGLLDEKAAMEKTKNTTRTTEPVQNSAQGTTYTLFVKNLNFSTTSARLSEVFKPLSGFLSAKVKTRTDPKRPGELLSMGFGFVEFGTKDQAGAALATMHATRLDGHELQVKTAQKATDAAEERRREDNARKVNAAKTKLVIKNLPFQTTKKDVRNLLKEYGQLRTVRLPKKFDNTARGFAFADFVTAKEAENAKEALSNTHLLGRRLVLDFAEAETVDPEEGIRAIEKKVGQQSSMVHYNKIATGSARRKFNVDAREGDDL